MHRSLIIYFSCDFVFTLLRGNCTPNQKLTCFALYFKIVNTFVQNNVYILKQIVQGIKECIGILVGQAVFKLWIKTLKYCFDNLL